jgi:nitrogenase molybdenum-iron protein beta chain
MANVLDQARYKCALAAMQTVQAIPGAIPILHSGPGCGIRLNDQTGLSGHYSVNIYPCSTIGEKEVVFGGERKLRDTIENAIKMLDAELYVVVTGCTSEIVGDDVGEVVSEFSDAEKPVISASTAGFKGNNYQGHDWVLKAIFDQYLPAETPQKEKGVVNLFAGPPVQDPFWLGNLRELERLLTEIGLKPNTIFGHGRGLQNVRDIPKAEFNLLVSPWVGLESVQFLEKKFGTPFLHYPVLPIGAIETSKFLRVVGEYAHLDINQVEKVVVANEKEYYYYIERFADTFLELRVMSKRFAILSDAQYSLAVTKFLVNDIGMFPTLQFITDNTPPEYRELVDAEFKNLNYGIEAKPEYSNNGFEMHRKIRESDFTGSPLILGSSWDNEIAQEVQAIFLNISYPIITRLIINSSVAGYAGGLKLLEDIYTSALARLAL